MEEGKCAPHVVHGECPSVAVEAVRAAKAKSLRSWLHRLCSKNGGKPPLLCFERWQARGALHGSEDPLLPPGGWVDHGMARDLKRGRIEGGEEIAEEMAKHAAKATKALQGMDVEEKEVWVTKRRTVDFSLAGERAWYSINYAHYDRLWELYGKGEDIDDFHRRCMCMLLRYAALGGHGYQAALNGEGFEVLRRHLKVDTECFASPLNSRFTRYYSAFPDVDRAFGSLGNFFEADLKEGSYEANPPFIPEVMSRCADRMREALETAKEALSFVVIIPDWNEVVALQLFRKSPYLKHHFTIPADEHGYLDGAQHMREHQYRPSSYDTAVFVLQNSEGAEKYSFEAAAMEADLREAMGRAIKESEFGSIAEYEQRFPKRPRLEDLKGRTTLVVV